MEIKQLAKELGKRAEDVCHMLYPEGKVNGKEFEVGDITGGKGDSLRVLLVGESAGLWTDFADGDQKGGDLIELWRRRKNQNLSQTLQEVHEYLGIDPEAHVVYKKKDYKKPPLKGEILRESSPVMRYLTEDRLLLPDTLREYRIQETSMKSKEWIEFPYYRNGEVIFIKYLALERKEGSKDFFVTPNAEPCLFGWDQLAPDAREVIITEGEINAMTLHQMGYNALATPFGGGSGNKHTWLETEYDRLDRFETVYILGDNDGPGRKMTEDLVKRVGQHRCKVLTLPVDANDCLKQAIDIAPFYKAAVYLEPIELKRPLEFLEGVVEHFYPTDSTLLGFAPRFIELFRDGDFQLRFRPGEYTVWTGYNFEGKSQAIKQMQLDALLQHERVLVVDFENPPELTMARLARSIIGLARPSEKMLQEALEWLDGKLWLLDWEDEAPLQAVIDSCTYAAKRFGVTQVFIDSLMCLSDVPEDDIDEQRKAVNKIVQFGKKYGVHTHLIAHFRKPPPAEVARLQIPSRFNISGTSKISDRAFNVIIMVRNRYKEGILSGDIDPEDGKKKEDYLNDPDALFVVDKQRNGTNWIGRLKLWWDQDSMQYLNKAGDKPINYIQRFEKNNGSDRTEN
jgi:twinkle protein